jgi:hypothetical protein
VLVAVRLVAAWVGALELSRGRHGVAVVVRLVTASIVARVLSLLRLFEVVWDRCHSRNSGRMVIERTRPKSHITPYRPDTGSRDPTLLLYKQTSNLVFQQPNWSAGGLVVTSIDAIDGSRVRFAAGARGTAEVDSFRR